MCVCVCVCVCLYLDRYREMHLHVHRYLPVGWDLYVRLEFLIEVYIYIDI